MDASTGTREEKKALRRELLGLLRSMPTDTRLASDAAIRNCLEQMPAYQQAKRLFFYIGTGWEVDTRPLIEDALAAGKIVAVPRCLPLSQAAPLPDQMVSPASLVSAVGTADTRDAADTGDTTNATQTPPPVLLGIMEACMIQSLAELRQVPPLGLWEPGEDAPLIEASSLDFAVIPCVACDTSGQRLGQGGGYYDRFLAGQSFVKVALCRQLVFRKSLPGDAHDQKVSFVVTDTGLHTV